ncbi:uncharacterized protein LOC122861104 [Aphidius gifuensis]|uniref:uncharacterized protein LOC122861104 n=1 Tax=Aphidius gifuensis TaxID=684658 RepID=UPI001CDB6FA9|nr:uncharacterized protein LOC122861104 [Aphidius gifuensis]
MERVWKRVQNATTSRNTGRCGCANQPCQLHVDQRAKRGNSAGVRKHRGPQTIVCSCQVQPCPVHPVLIRVRRTRTTSCDCPPESQPCPHANKLPVSRRVKSGTSGISRRRPQGSFSLPSVPFIPNSQNPIGISGSCNCPTGPGCPHTPGDDGCECVAQPCLHTIKSRRRICDCTIQPCNHTKTTSDGRMKRVKCRVRRAGCAMARCTAELAMLKLHWELATECAPCKPRALTRRLCRRQASDNELYRSNSFKFERFERTKDDCSTPSHKQISLRDDYCIPVDFVNKRRPASASAVTTTVQWALPSPSVENEKEGSYPSASDSSCDNEITGQLEKSVVRKSNPYLSTGRTSRASRDTKETVNNTVTVDCVAQVHVSDQSPTESNQPIRHPSPYYYGDLFKTPDQIPKSQPTKYRKSISLDVPNDRSRTPGLPKRNSVAGDGAAPFTNTAPGGSKEEVSPTGSEHAGPIHNNEILSSCIITEWDHTLMPPHRLLSHDLPTTSCMCVASPDEDEINEPNKVARHQVRKLRRARRIEPQQPVLVEYDAEAERAGDEADVEEDEAADAEDYDDEDMARQRQLYETAFDCKVNRSDDDLDDVDRLTNHAVLHSQLRIISSAQSRASSSTDGSKKNSQYTGQLAKDNRRKIVVLKPKPIPIRLQHNQPDALSNLSHEIESLQINSGDENTSSRLPVRGYTQSPPSTAPLPAKFHNNKDHLLLNMHSTPNLPSQPDQSRLKDIRLPVKSLKSNESHQSNDGILEIKSRPKSLIQENNQSQLRRGDKDFILEFKERPKEERQRPRSLIRENRPIMEFKGRPHEAESDILRSRREAGIIEFKLRPTRRRIGYSSTESMATSSSGGSMESIRSSTSEGNRSTSSSESRHSTSLSSHSSDSGSTNCFHHHHHQPSATLSGFLTYHASKLHILSPISDKSSQEPASETSENNRNNNSQKASPEESTQENIIVNTNNTNNTINTNNTNNTNAITSIVVSPSDNLFKKRRTPQNKNLINLALQSSSSGDAEIQGSDSGISIESRAGIKCKPFQFHLIKPQLDNINIADNEPDLSDLPFDMPKLRRRRLQIQQDATTSGSATSVDLRDLPFDMPKLRRRLRCTQSTESSASQASSSLSVRDIEPAIFGGGTTRPKMTLNLDSSGNNGVNGVGLQIMKKPGGLSLGLPLELTTTRASADLVDVDLPLERQGWYHGSLTRIEAEAVLRILREGSYLVRNSESTKQDYSLSLKSARGFMHMRIQRNDDLNAYILGQFSKPFETIPEMVRHFSVNRLPIRGAEHMCLLHPVIAQLL